MMMQWDLGFALAERDACISCGAFALHLVVSHYRLLFDRRWAAAQSS